MNVAFVFPGQGAQKVGMGRELFEASPAARSVFEQADKALGEPLSELIFEGPAEDLTLTANTQPAILTVSVAAWRALAEHFDGQPSFVAGHSLGEFSALVCAGAMNFQDAVTTTRARGEFMQAAVPAGQGAMAAVLRKSADEVAKVCQATANGEVVSPANFNSPEQIVISGHAGAVQRASEALTQAGARVIPLKVSAPFHCALMESAAQNLNNHLAGIDFVDPQVPVLTNVTAEPNTSGDQVRELLVRQVTSTVRWTDSIRYMLGKGVDTFIELGPGKVLAGLIGKTEKDAEVISAGTPGDIEKVAEILHQKSHKSLEGCA